MFGEFLVEEGYVTRSQVEEALRLQQTLRRRPVGEVLVSLGILTSQTLEESLSQYFQTMCTCGEKRRKFGGFLVDEGYITEIQLTRGLSEQRRLRAQKLGELLVDLGYLRNADLEHALRRRLRDHAYALDR